MKLNKKFLYRYVFPSWAVASVAVTCYFINVWKSSLISSPNLSGPEVTEVTPETPDAPSDPAPKDGSGGDPKAQQENTQGRSDHETGQSGDDNSSSNPNPSTSTEPPKASPSSSSSTDGQPSSTSNATNSVEQENQSSTSTTDSSAKAPGEGTDTSQKKQVDLEKEFQKIIHSLGDFTKGGILDPKNEDIASRYYIERLFSAGIPILKWKLSQQAK